MVLLDPVVIEDDNGPLTQYRSSFAYTEYDYADDGDADGSSANQRVPEFPITGTFYNRHAYLVPRVCVCCTAEYTASQSCAYVFY